MRITNSLPLLGLYLLIAVVSVSCDQSTSSPAPISGKPTVYVPVAPYAFLAESIGGDLFDVQTLASENDDPHSFSPAPKDVVRLSTSQIYFTGELPFENALLEKLKESKFAPRLVNLLDNLDTVDGSCDHGDHSHDHDEHSHDDDEHSHDHDGHDHSGLDPHVWLSPAHLIEQVNIMSAALRKLTDSPEEKEQIDERTLQLIFDITTTDKELASALAPLRGQTFYVYHGAFGYFANAYGLVQKSVELNGRSPEPKELVNLIKQAKKDSVSVIFVQPQFDSSSATALAEAIGGKVLPIDPLSKNVLDNLLNIADKISSK